MKHLILSALVVLLASCSSTQNNLFSSNKRCDIPGGTVCVKCNASLPVWRNNICNHCGNVPTHAIGYVVEYYTQMNMLKQNKDSMTLVASTDRFGNPINTFGEPR